MSHSSQQLGDTLLSFTYSIDHIKDRNQDFSCLRPPVGHQLTQSSSTPDPLYSDGTDADNADEYTLLRGSQKATPLPWGQISIILFLQICEPLTSMSIYPYINQLVGGLIIDSGKGNEPQVGYYAGAIMSLFFVTEAMTVLQWSRISDHVGRKPILLVGLFGTAVSMLSFGLSRTYWSLVVSRCLCGLLNGNISVMKSVMGELTDSSNRAKGVALMPAVWAAGAALGPLIGGTLANPSERFPGVFGGEFWQRFPYFLPCVATASFVLVAFGLTLICFKETLKSSTHHAESDTRETSHHASDAPVPLRHLLVYPVLLSISNYVVLAFLNISLEALLPLFLAMPLSTYGLGFDPATIGLIFGFYGAFTGILQALFFPTFVHYCGVKRVFVIGVAAFCPIFSLFPIISLNAQEYGVNAFTWTCIAAMLVLMCLMDMSFGCIFIYITASVPNKRSLGATNGLSQTAVSIGRAVGPSLATSLFAVSVEHKILWGYGVYAILLLFSSCALSLACLLPKNVWEEAENET